jgi:hypothetical protein
MPTNKTRGEAVSKSQQRLVQAAEHGATFPLAQQIRRTMTYAQMHNFAIGSEQGKPEHVRPKKRRKTDPRD